jgi:hypothetical protein
MSGGGVDDNDHEAARDDINTTDGNNDGDGSVDDNDQEANDDINTTDNNNDCSRIRRI